MRIVINPIPSRVARAAAGGQSTRRRDPAVEGRLSERGIAPTRQRRLLARILFSRGVHLGAEELHALAQEEDPRIGIATVYRTLGLLTSKGLLTERDFGEGRRRWEPSGVEHHDHLLCTRCGRVQEFDEPEIEALQERVAKNRGFVPESHRMEIYGTCATCRSSSGGARGTRDRASGPGAASREARR